MLPPPGPADRARLRASLARRESRAGHFRVEYPEADRREGLVWVNLRRSEAGRMLIETEPVPLDAYPIQPRAATAGAA